MLLASSSVIGIYLLRGQDDGDDDDVNDDDVTDDSYHYHHHKHCIKSIITINECLLYIYSHII